MSAAVPDLARLAERLSPDPAKVVEVEHCGRRPSRYATTHGLDELDVQLTDGTVTRLVAKRFRSGASRNGEKAIEPFSKPTFLRHPMREVFAYERILEPEQLDTARYYGQLREPDPAAVVLLLERVEGRELYQVGERTAWKAAATWLGRLHARFEGRTERLLEQVPLLAQDRSLHLRWLARARRFAFRDAGRRDRLTALRAPFHHAADVLALQPRTFLHGDFYASNVLVQEASSGDDGARRGWRVRPVDWELAGVGPGVLDLAALVAGGWTSAERGELAEAYRRSWPDSRWRDGDELTETLVCARLVVAMQWLGWTRHWTPPPDHSQDWLRVAEDAASRL